MPVQVSYPGVYVQEEPSGVQTITGVSTSIALFVGMAQRGPMDRATNLLSFTAYERTFGSDTTVSETTDQVRQFFLNGGSQAYVIRIADGAQAASVDLDNEAQAVVLRLTAVEPGRIGESVRVEVNYATAQPESTFNLVVSREIIDASGEPTLVETETIGELSMNPSAARFVETAVEQESRLIRAAVQDTGTGFNGYSMSGRAEADWLAALNTQLASQANTGRFQISVDGGPSVPVLLNGPVAAIGDIQSAVDLALGGLGAVTVALAPVPPDPPTEHVLLIQSQANGGQVRIQPGVGADIAGPMHLGTANGGLEVDGHAARRPAPTGLFASLGELDVGDPATPVLNWLNRLVRFLRAVPDDLQAAHRHHNPAHGHLPDNGDHPPELLGGRRRGNPAAPRPRRAGADLAADRDGRRRELHVEPPGLPPGAEPDLCELRRAGERGCVHSSPGAYDIGDNATGYFGLEPNVRRIPLGSYTTPSNYATGGDAGLDGNKPQLAQYNAAFERASREIDIFNLLILPRVLRDGSGSNQTDAERALLWGPASAFCRNERAFLLIDPPATWRDDANAARNDIAKSAHRRGRRPCHGDVAAPQHPRSCDRAAQDRGPERVARWSRGAHRRHARRVEGAGRPGSHGPGRAWRRVPHLRRRERADQSPGYQRHPAVPERDRDLGLTHARRLRQLGTG